jgi:hypothetical protein
MTLRNCFEKIRCQLPSSETVFPRSHLSDQNRMLSPLPSMDSTATLKRTWAFLGIWIGNPAQGENCLSCQAQSHLMRRGHPNYSRSWIPSPPYCSGILTRFQETRQFPPFAFSRKVNFLLITQVHRCIYSSLMTRLFPSNSTSLKEGFYFFRPSEFSTFSNTTFKQMWMLVT